MGLQTCTVARMLRKRELGQCDLAKWEYWRYIQGRNSIPNE